MRPACKTAFHNYFIQIQISPPLQPTPAIFDAPPYGSHRDPDRLSACPRTYHASHWMHLPELSDPARPVAPASDAALPPTSAKIY